ncbi:zinc finger and BTB domain-containing protein 17-like isoform X1 [Calliphora vicina]|uniref:zinc finger and BTB domain-containing protein 17-like isoform X1 n=1 Tax=Calliphora vicina TaxID=7373 RepID=UPI00325B9865
MSVDVIEPTCMLPQKRARESITLSDDSVSKCGELFVTNCADKWTFYCTYCQKATTDIGVFICHIRLEHLNEQQDLQQSQQTTPALASHVAAIQNDLNLDRSSSGTPIECSLPSEEPAANTEEQKQPIARHIVKEEPKVEARGQEHFDYMPICTTVSKIVDISALTQPASKEMEDDISDKIFPSSNPLEEQFNEEFVILSPKAEAENIKEVIEVVYINDENINEEEDMHDVSDTAGSQYDGESNEEDELTNESGTDEDNQASVSTVTKKKRFRRSIINKCEYCQKYIRTKSGLIKHIIKRHDKNYYKDFPYQCQKCIRGFKSKNGLKFHEKMHDSKVFVQCPLCPAKLRDNYFATHIMTHESETCFPCQVCGEIFSSHEQRLQHWNTHAVDQPFGCNICYRRYKKQQYLLKHLKCHKSHNCYFCKEEFNSLVAQLPPYACRNCEKKKVKYLTYKEAVEPTEDSTKDDSNLESLDDDNTPSGSLNYTTTESINRATKCVVLLYKCQDCKYKSTTKSGMQKHLESFHRKYRQTNLPFKCEQCNRSFKTKSGQSSHLKTHDKNNQFQCPVCPQTFVRDSIFVPHVMSHESESCFPCQVCAKIFPTNTERLAHYQPHIKERPHGCDICYRRFYHQHYLRSHLKTHGVYFCNFCPQHFKSKANLQKPYVCGNCEKLPDIKSTVDHQRSLSNIRHVFDSDEDDEEEEDDD